MHRSRYQVSQKTKFRRVSFEIYVLSCVIITQSFGNYSEQLIGLENTLMALIVHIVFDIRCKSIETEQSEQRKPL